MSEIAELMRAANPVPDPTTVLTSEDSAALLLLTRTRSGDMDVKEVVTPVEPERRNYRGWLVAAAAFAVVIVVIGAALLLVPAADDSPPATTPPTTQAVTPTTQAAPPTTQAAPPTTVSEVLVAEPEPVLTDEVVALIDSYEASFNAGDVEAFRSLFAANALRTNKDNPGLDVTVGDLTDEMLSMFVQQSSLDIESCAATSYGARCSFAYSGPVEDALYFGPRLYTDRLYIDSGKISKIVSQCGLANCRPDVWLEVPDWVAETNPEDGASMGDPWPFLAREDAELWLKYAPLWVEAGRP